VQTFTATDNVGRMEGKLNVPIRPLVQPGNVLFLWPGINPNGGLLQPVLAYGWNYGQGIYRWGFANWYSACPGYCHSTYIPVVEGDTFYFWMQYLLTYSNGSTQWEMGFQSYNYPETRNIFMVYRGPSAVTKIWATESEFYLNPADPSNQPKLPQSSFYIWDIKIFNKNGQQITQRWTPVIDQPTGNHVECQWSNANGFNGTKLSFPPYNDGCNTAGFSRDWNYGCQSYCGCNNLDGTPKVTCDWCCAVINDQCFRMNGPNSDGCTDGYSREWNYGCQSYCGCNNDDGTQKFQCDYCCAVIGGSCYRL